MGKVIELFPGRRLHPKPRLDYKKLPLNGFKVGDKVSWVSNQGTVIDIDWTPGELYPIVVAFRNGYSLGFTATGFRPESSFGDEPMIVTETK